MMVLGVVWLLRRQPATLGVLSITLRATKKQAFPNPPIEGLTVRQSQKLPI